ncbi:MAG: indole-3-glycerol phosphate synthase TrpC, partial [Thermoanaerobaculia bacterium]|nr:indole-3-glycerol phosphate synthase TrpC [Thermoanaerobaculia bacterium]
RQRIDPERQASIYATHGAAALSVVVEPDRFHGSYELLALCIGASGLPALAKDFVVDPLQLEWARRAGASAVLLIAALYEPQELAGYAAAARRLGLVPLVELHGEGDLDRLAAARLALDREWGEASAWELVGVNNRDLRSFEVDLAHGERLAPRLPRAAVKVAESGIASAADVDRLAAAGFDAFLVGESLLLAADPAAQLRALVATTADAPNEPAR